MNDGRSQTEQIDDWLAEGLRFYSQGDPARALEAWNRILHVDVGHALAQQYVSYVRQAYQLDPVAQAPGTSARPAIEQKAAASPVRPSSSVVSRAAAGSHLSETTDSDARRLLGYDASSSWSDLVDSSFDVTVPIEPTPSKPMPRPASPPKLAANPWAVPARRPSDLPPLPPAAPQPGALVPRASLVPLDASPDSGEAFAAHGHPWITSDLPGWEAVGSANATPPDNRPGSAGAGIPGSTPGFEGPLAAAPPPRVASLATTSGPVEAPAGPEGRSSLRPGPAHAAGGFDPWRGDTISPSAPPAEWGETFELPPTPPPIDPAQFFPALRSPEVVRDAHPGDVRQGIGEAPFLDAQTNVEAAGAPEVMVPVPAWKRAAIDQVGPGELGPRLRNIGGGGRVDVQPGNFPASEGDRTAQWPVAPFEERVVKQSVRFGDESPVGHAKAQPAVPIDSAPGKVIDPWDEVGGPGVSLDLDVDLDMGGGSLLGDVLGHERAPGGFSTASLDLVTSAAPEDECTALMRGGRELFDLGDFSGSLDLIEKVLKIEPNHEGARAYLQRNESTLIKMYESKLGDMRKAPKPLMPPDEVIWMNMHHKAGFLLSQVDGMLSYEDLLDVSGMPRFDTMRILHELVQQGIIG